MLVNIYASKNKINNLLSVNTRKLPLFKLKKSGKHIKRQNLQANISHKSRFSSSLKILSNLEQYFTKNRININIWRLPWLWTFIFNNQSMQLTMTRDENRKHMITKRDVEKDFNVNPKSTVSKSLSNCGREENSLNLLRKSWERWVGNTITDIERQGFKLISVKNHK